MEEISRNVGARPKAREFAFSLLFAKSFSPEEAADVVYARELENAEIELGEQLDYVHKVFFGVCDCLAELDEKISEAAVGWSLTRLSRAALTIMRLSIYEMTALDDVPKRVALNEAIELSKLYDEEKTTGFINGVLNKVAASLPDRDCDK